MDGGAAREAHNLKRHRADWVLTPSPDRRYRAGVRRLIPIVFIPSAIVLTWPLLLHLSSHIPLGSEPAGTVPLLNVWTVGWNGTSLANGFSEYWDAPIFYPSRGAFAFSDPQPLTAIPGALLWRSSPAVAYNVVLLGYLALNGLVTFRVLRQRGVMRGPALAGGLLVQALPIVTNERGVLQLQPLFGPIFAIGALWNLLERSSLRRALLLGLALGVTFLTSEYFALLLVPALSLGGLLHMPGLRSVTTWRRLGLAAALGAAMVLPVALPQADRLEAMGFQRSERTFARTSAWPADYLRPSSRLRIAEIVPEVGFVSNQRLYPGLLLTMLAVVGLRTSLRSNRRRQWALFLLLTGGFGFVLSLGAHLTIGGVPPLTALHQVLPVLNFTRSPFRFALLLQLALAFLAADGLKALWPHKRNLAIAVAVLALVELSPASERLMQVPRGEHEWIETVQGSEQPVVVHLPWAPDRSASSFARTTRWMIEALPDGIKLVNGYSGFFPTLNTQLRELMREFPTERGIAALKALGVDFVVVHEVIDRTRLSRLEAFLELGRITQVGPTDQLTVIRLPGGSLQGIAEYEGDWRLQAELEGGKHYIEALPADSFDGFLVYSAGATESNWLAEFSGIDAGRVPIAPLGSQLVYADSDHWLPLGIQLPVDQSMRMIDASSGVVVAEIPSRQGPRINP
jgi:hypothetical protein